jgi:hypothetical protein
MSSLYSLLLICLICTADPLNPRAHYISGMSPSQLNVLRTVFERMTGLDTATVALSEAQTFYANADSFSSPRLENGG